MGKCLYLDLWIFSSCFLLSPVKKLYWFWLRVHFLHSSYCGPELLICAGNSMDNWGGFYLQLSMVYSGQGLFCSSVHPTSKKAGNAQGFGRRHSQNRLPQVTKEISQIAWHHGQPIEMREVEVMVLVFQSHCYAWLCLISTHEFSSCYSSSSLPHPDAGEWVSSWVRMGCCLVLNHNGRGNDREVWWAQESQLRITHIYLLLYFPLLVSSSQVISLLRWKTLQNLIVP